MKRMVTVFGLLSLAVVPATATATAAHAQDTGPQWASTPEGSARAAR